jgi:hypothetical protein
VNDQIADAPKICFDLNQPTKIRAPASWETDWGSVRLRMVGASVAVSQIALTGTKQCYDQRKAA